MVNGQLTFGSLIVGVRGTSALERRPMLALRFNGHHEGG
jgi:hypothetical protein